MISSCHDSARHAPAAASLVQRIPALPARRDLAPLSEGAITGGVAATDGVGLRRAGGPAAIGNAADRRSERGSPQRSARTGDAFGGFGSPGALPPKDRYRGAVKTGSLGGQPPSSSRSHRIAVERPSRSVGPRPVVGEKISVRCRRDGRWSTKMPMSFATQSSMRGAVSACPRSSPAFPLQRAECGRTSRRIPCPNDLLARRPACLRTQTPMPNCAESHIRKRPNSWT